MPSISGDKSRHVILDRRDDEYLCFPDVCLTHHERLICAYNEYDQHVSTRRGMVVKTSEDGGQTWSTPVKLSRNRGHCPRLTLLASGEVHLLDYNGTLVYVSKDEGRSWSKGSETGLYHRHVVADRPLELTDDSLLTTGHSHRGVNPLPNLRQASTEQMVFRSTDGLRYNPWSVIYSGRYLTLCEASICSLPDGRLAALMRENSQVFEPMYLCLSDDQGCSWSEPMPTPLVGHRPTLGVTSSGKLLVTYRDVSPDGGTAAWLGTLDELTGPYLVHGIAPENTKFTEHGMHVPPSKTPGRWALRPMTDATTATAVIECEMQAMEQDDEATCGVHLGLWWRIYPDHIKAKLPTEHEDDKPRTLRRKIPAGQVNTLRFTYASGKVTLHVNGRKRAEMVVDANAATTRAMVFGGMNKKSGEQVWRRMTQRISEPRFARDYAWEWNHSQGLPHAGKQAAVLELDNDRQAHYGDFGYSGWCELENGQFFCTYHHASSEKADYTPNFSAHVRGAWFTEDDFS